VKHIVRVTRSRIEQADVVIESSDKAEARMQVEEHIANGELPVKWKPRSTGRSMIESIKREGE